MGPLPLMIGALQYPFADPTFVHDSRTWLETDLIRLRQPNLAKYVDCQHEKAVH